MPPSHAPFNPPFHPSIRWFQLHTIGSLHHNALPHLLLVLSLCAPSHRSPLPHLHVALPLPHVPSLTSPQPSPSLTSIPSPPRIPPKVYFDDFLLRLHPFPRSLLPMSSPPHPLPPPFPPIVFSLLPSPDPSSTLYLHSSSSRNSPTSHFSLFHPPPFSSTLPSSLHQTHPTHP